MPSTSSTRRRLLRNLGAGTLGAVVPSRLLADFARRDGAGADLCLTPARFDVPLRVPRADGLMGRLTAGANSETRPAAARGADGMPMFSARTGGREYLDP